ncbi:uncharacterized protein [Dermacentor albipictus]|uniref:uncharacterized protein isoform X2 n=1 Tax=Dermacentor albipictus TaxID=60249 RepID=UPI0031FBBEDD
MYQAKGSSGKGGSYDTAKVSRSAPEFGSRTVAHSGYPETIRPSSSYSMPDLMRAGAAPWWGGVPMMEMMMRPPGGAIPEVHTYGPTSRGAAETSHGRSMQRTSMPRMPGFLPPPGMAMFPGYPLPQMAAPRGSFPSPYFPGAPRRMPRMMPGMVPGMRPGMMPGMMPGFMPGGMPRMFPGFPPGTTPGYPLAPGMMPGFAPMHPQLPATMMSPYGQGSFMPYPMSVPVPGGGAGGSGVTIITGGSSLAPQQPYPYAPPYQYPPPEQQTQGNAMAEAAAMMMMMQQMRSMMSRRGSRRRQPRPRGRAPAESHSPSPPSPPDAAADDKGLKKSATKAGQDSAESLGKKSVPKPEVGKAPKEVDLSLKPEKPAGKEAKEQKSKEVEGGTERTETDAGVKKADSTITPKSHSGMQQTTGKGPDSSAPSLSLNFPSTTALGHHVTASDEETEAQHPFNWIGLCCYALFVGFLVCLVVMAIAPTVLWTLLDFFGISKAEKTPKTVSVESENMTTLVQQFDIDVVSTEAPFFYMAETFGEIGVDDDLQDGAFAEVEAWRNNSGWPIDWQRILGAIPKTEHEVANQTTPRLPYPRTNDRFPHRKSRTTDDKTVWRQRYVSKRYNQHQGSPLELGAIGDKSAGDAQSSLKGKDRADDDKPTNVTASIDSAWHSASSATQTSEYAVQPPSTKIEGTTKSAIRELIDNLLLKRPQASTAPPTQWPLQGRLPFLPRTVYFEWIPTQQIPTTAARRRRTRWRGGDVTLSFQMPEVPTLDIGKVIFYKVFRDFGDEETTPA